MERVRLVEDGQVSAVAAKVPGIAEQTLDNWVRLSKKGKLKDAGDKPISAEQTELARLLGITTTKQNFKSIESMT